MPKKLDLIGETCEELSEVKKQFEPIAESRITTANATRLEQTIGDKNNLPKAIAEFPYHNDEYFNNLTKFQEIGEHLNSRDFQNAIGKRKANAYLKSYNNVDKAILKQSTARFLNVNDDIGIRIDEMEKSINSHTSNQNKLMNKYFINLLDDYDKFKEKNSKPASEKSWVEKLTDRIKDKTPEKTNAKMKAYEAIVKIIGVVREPLVNKILREKNLGAQNPESLVGARIQDK